MAKGQGQTVSLNLSSVYSVYYDPLILIDILIDIKKVKL